MIRNDSFLSCKKIRDSTLEVFMLHLNVRYCRSQPQSAVWINVCLSYVICVKDIHPYLTNLSDKTELQLLLENCKHNCKHNFANPYCFKPVLQYMYVVSACGHFDASFMFHILFTTLTIYRQSYQLSLSSSIRNQLQCMYNHVCLSIVICLLQIYSTVYVCDSQVKVQS